MTYHTYTEEQRAEKIDAILDAMDALAPLLRKCRTDDQLLESVRATSVVVSRKKTVNVLNCDVRRIDAVREGMDTLFELCESFDIDLRLAYIDLTNRVLAEASAEACANRPVDIAV